MISVDNQSAECVDIDPFAIVESSVVSDPSCDSVITSAAQIRAALSICNGVYCLCSETLSVTPELPLCHAKDNASKRTVRG